MNHYQRNFQLNYETSVLINHIIYHGVFNMIKHVDIFEGCGNHMGYMV